jgi:hypothetical protein
MDTKEKQIQKLVADFSEASSIHFDATIAGDWKSANSHAKKINKSFLEIRKLGTDARTALLNLVDTEPFPVAAMAAVYSLKFCPERALAALEKIAKEPSFIGFEAEQAIKRWTEGSWQLE